jgi:hypothetical protein
MRRILGYDSVISCFLGWNNSMASTAIMPRCGGWPAGNGVVPPRCSTLTICRRLFWSMPLAKPFVIPIWLSFYGLADPHPDGELQFSFFA